MQASLHFLSAYSYFGFAEDTLARQNASKLAFALAYSYLCGKWNKMKAAIIGYGKMGREIERILTERGHEAALVIDTDNAGELERRVGFDELIDNSFAQQAYKDVYN